MTEAAYCPVCDQFLEDVDLDEGAGTCWNGAAFGCCMTGLRQPAIHFRDVIFDTYEIRNGYGEVVEVRSYMRSATAQKLGFYGATPT